MIRAAGAFFSTGAVRLVYSQRRQAQEFFISNFDVKIHFFTSLGLKTFSAVLA
jgi:hypothetical protein